MTDKEKVILAQIQTNNLLELIKGMQYTGFFTSHLLPIKYELERQLVLLKDK